MKYNRFEELPVWQAAIELAVLVFNLTSRSVVRRFPGICYQIERAALSVSNNIAEGFERGTTKELLNFLYISRGSAGETRSVLCLMESMPQLTPVKEQVLEIKPLAESISRQLRAWCEALQNSDVAGPRYLNDDVRRRMRQAKERDEFLRELEEIKRRGKE